MNLKKFASLPYCNEQQRITVDSESQATFIIKLDNSVLSLVMDDFGWLPPPKRSRKSDSLDTFLVGTLPEPKQRQDNAYVKFWTDKIRVFNSGADA